MKEKSYGRDSWVGGIIIGGIILDSWDIIIGGIIENDVEGCIETFLPLTKATMETIIINTGNIKNNPVRMLLHQLHSPFVRQFVSCIKSRAKPRDIRKIIAVHKLNVPVKIA